MRVGEKAIYGYQSLRSAGYKLESLLLNQAAALVPAVRKFRMPVDASQVIASERALRELLRQDSRNVAEGVYPVSVLKPESPVRHLKRIPRVILDGFGIFRRRARGQTARFRPEAQDYLREVPRYYRRNFHFQRDGYLSPVSAELYEHQVELLFLGAADAMRRLILKPMLGVLGRKDGGHGLHILELGAGTGRATRFTRLTFPKARIVVNDLSDFYLKEARRSLARFTRTDFLQADAAALPFQPAKFDAVYSVFVLHEMPLSARREVLAEAKRLVKPGGFVGVVDSIQLHDRPDFDELIRHFPVEYHEPFYRNYAENPLEELFEEAGFTSVKSELGYMSKVVWGLSGRPRT